MNPLKLALGFFQCKQSQWFFQVVCQSAGALGGEPGSRRRVAGQPSRVGAGNAASKSTAGSACEIRASLLGRCEATSLPWAGGRRRVAEDVVGWRRTSPSRGHPCARSRGLSAQEERRGRLGCARLWTLALFSNRYGNEIRSWYSSRYGNHELTVKVNCPQPLPHLRTRRPPPGPGSVPAGPGRAGRGVGKLQGSDLRHGTDWEAGVVQSPRCH